jgi:rhamnosyltransferase
MKRILFFVHYNKYNDLADYVIYLLDNIKQIFSRIVFISNSNLNDQQKFKLTGLYNSLIIRENKGFDFGAWKDALLQEGWNNLATYDNVTLMNDSCFGPFYGMGNIYNRMEQMSIDFWGISGHTAMNYGMPITDDPIPEHIQSYFICFTKKIINDDVFQNFWKSLSYEKNIKIVIQKYESQLTPILKKNGYNYAVLIESGDEISISFSRPDLFIINEAPLVKIKSFYSFSNLLYIKQLIKNKTSYPVSLIENYFSDLYDPAISFKIENKIFNHEFCSVNNSDISLPKIAVHINVDNPIVLQKCITIFDKWEIDYHLFITTDKEEKKKKIIEIMQNHIFYKNVKEIIVLKYHSQDILLWLNMAEKLKNYEIAGNFYMNNLDEIQDYFELLLTPINKIVNIINTNKKIGIIIPDIPDPLPLQLIVGPKEKRIKFEMDKLWKKMYCKKEIQFKNLSMLIFPYGNMFWYRPSALSPLVEFCLKNKSITEKCFLKNKLVLECLSRILVYIAWSEGYDFRISAWGTREESAFYCNLMISNYAKKYLTLNDYRIERLVLFLNRFAKNILRKSKKIIIKGL